MNREVFFGFFRGRLNADGLGLMQNAYWFAKDVHRTAKRDNGERYFEHCRRVALILMLEMDLCHPVLLSVALLHDVIEDTFVPAGVLLRIFGHDVFHHIQLLSKTAPIFDNLTGKLVSRARIENDIYYGRIASACDAVKIVKCADRLDNLRSLGVWPEERKERYVQETRKYIFPIAEKTNMWFVDAMEKAIERVSSAA